MGRVFPPSLLFEEIMPTTVNFNGTVYSIPNTGELNWQSLTSFLVDVGTNAQTTNFQKSGARIATTSPVTVNSQNDSTIIVNLTVAGPAQVNLPAGVTGQIYSVVDGKGDAATNNITITPAAGTINGQAALILNRNRSGVYMIYTGSEYVTISEFVNVPSGFDASLINSGVLADGRIQESNVTQHEGALALAATQITTGVLADGRIQESNVTQHEGAIDHNALNNYVSNQHINWTSATQNLVTTGSSQSLAHTSTGTGADKLPVGTDAQRPANSTGLLRYNTDQSAVEYNDGSTWNQVAVATGAVGAVPLGGIVAIDDRWANTAASIPATGAVSAQGFARCDGQPVSGLPAGAQAALGAGAANLPNLTDNRFIRGVAAATGAGGTGGGSITIAASNLPTHTHVQTQMSVSTSFNKTVMNTNQTAHTHGMQNHTHSMQDHTHDLRNHQHTITHDHGSFNTSSAGSHIHSRVSSRNAGGSSASNISSPSVGNTTIASSFNNTWNLNVRSDSSSHQHNIDVPSFSGSSGLPSINATGNPSSNTTGTPSNNTTTGGSASWTSATVTTTGNTSSTPNTSDGGFANDPINNVQPLYFDAVYLMRVQ